MEARQRLVGLSGELVAGQCVARDIESSIASELIKAEAAEATPTSKAQEQATFLKLSSGGFVALSPEELRIVQGLASTQAS